jgi:S1-C subfamily serine protease
VSVTDPAGPWARAGLADGDLIVALDGDELGSGTELEVAWAALRTRDRATLGVLRGGTRLEVTVNAKELFRGGAGGRVDWATR